MERGGLVVSERGWSVVSERGWSVVSERDGQLFLRGEGWLFPLEVTSIDHLCAPNLHIGCRLSLPVSLINLYEHIWRIE